MNELIIAASLVSAIALIVAVAMMAYKAGLKHSKADGEIQKNISYGQGYTNGFREGKMDLLKEMREVQLINDGMFDALSHDIR